MAGMSSRRRSSSCLAGMVRGILRSVAAGVVGVGGASFNVRQGKRLFESSPAAYRWFLFGGFLTTPIAIPRRGYGLLVATALCVLVTLLLTLSARRLFPERFDVDAALLPMRRLRKKSTSNVVQPLRAADLTGFWLAGRCRSSFDDFAERLGCFPTEVEVAAVLGICSYAARRLDDAQRPGAGPDRF